MAGNSWPEDVRTVVPWSSRVRVPVGRAKAQNNAGKTPGRTGRIWARKKIARIFFGEKTFFFM